MKKREFVERLDAMIPQTPPCFHHALLQTLEEIAAEEKEGEEIIMTPVRKKSYTLAIVLAVVLLLAAVATAATLLRHNVFEVTMGDVPSKGGEMIQYDLAEETVGNFEIKIREAAYDGMSLYIAYSIRDLTAEEPMGVAEAEDGIRYLSVEDAEKMADWNVGWWWDNIWIDGEAIDMPSMSGGEETGSDTPGELLSYQQYRLDQEGVFLTGDRVEIALPIGERQTIDAIVRDPESGQVLLPEKGMVTFYLDCSSRDEVVTATPNEVTHGEQWDAQVSSVVYSPIQMYITLDWNVHENAMEAYIAENGDGYYIDGEKMWDYNGLDVCGGVIMSLELVKKDGTPVFASMRGYYGCGGCGPEEAWFTFPYLEEYPDEMFLAPVGENGADMTQAIRVR